MIRSRREELELSAATEAVPDDAEAVVTVT